MAYVDRESPIMVWLCPGLPRRQAVALLLELVDGLKRDGRFDRFVPCPRCQPRKGRKVMDD
jgi:hypothetical protein